MCCAHLCVCVFGCKTIMNVGTIEKNYLRASPDIRVPLFLKSAVFHCSGRVFYGISLSVSYLCTGFRQVGFTWRNPVRVASPHRIKSFLCQSVSLSVCA